jgi:nucleotide-binding universal stress UspA family protein
MTKPVNLRQYRKAKARADKARVADVNRVVHGTPKAVRELEQARQDQAARALEAHRRTAEGEADGQAPGQQAADGDNT